MQRWILWLVLALVGLALVGGGGLYGYREYSGGRPSPIWVPIPLNSEVSPEKQDEIATQIGERLRSETILQQVVEDLGLVAEFEVADAEAAIKELDRRLFVEVGVTNTESGPVSTMNVGVKGTRREKALSTKITERIVKEVFLMIGLNPETGQPLDR